MNFWEGLGVWVLAFYVFSWLKEKFDSVDLRFLEGAVGLVSLGCPDWLDYWFWALDEISLGEDLSTLLPGF